MTVLGVLGVLGVAMLLTCVMFIRAPNEETDS